MKVSTVTARVKKEYIDQFINATLVHHANTIREKGNIRFDFLQSKHDPSLFLFYEAYESEKAIEMHRRGTSYQAWRITVECWMEKPREGIQFDVIAPADVSMWKYPVM